MKGFKLLSGDENQQVVEQPTTLWRFLFDTENPVELLNDNHVVSGTYHGIRDFLSSFPEGYLVIVVSIVGPSDVTHFKNGQYEYGWGFNILEDTLQITFLSF
jgi:hypothetical protein